jgi:uncharacterized protein
VTIDACVHPLCAHKDDLRRYMREPWRSRSFPGPERYFYPAPNGEYVGGEGEAAGNAVAADPAKLSREIFGQGCVDKAILVPLTRGMLPDLDQSMAICRATNDWLADQWLGRGEGGKFVGTIRVDPREPEQAVAEIKRWASHPDMVQIAVPLQAQRPYGNRDYLPVWQAAAEHGLPVLIQSDGGSSIDYWPSPVGYYKLFLEYATLYPINFSYHLVSLIAEGVFDRLQNFKVIFGDGGADLLAPLIWRVDKDWRPTRSETPWNSQMPSHYVRKHVRFLSSRFEGPQEDSDWNTWLAVSEMSNLTLFASKFPMWQYDAPSSAFKSLGDKERRAILETNTSEFYGLA